MTLGVMDSATYAWVRTCGNALEVWPGIGDCNVPLVASAPPQSSKKLT
eukprot:CAMPEP_0174364712 /NCGR_PEP_ID=MMETSP0811_2-20130205/74074_1 /TAXON_ID=73025 ORGANISM="Eutreptiella gymnastica-like, Strain CCMP1594" /NCGR_SAMPLE_ID=MMETSP0811_2 /ASSEMBLY_ACC=CAM_ASM_000667 /LENGTH=47 /DNA_ID= /DNA_START= /DNA_END= /DNA_ORIENTATION=